MAAFEVSTEANQVDLMSQVWPSSTRPVRPLHTLDRSGELNVGGSVVGRERLGGVLKYYRRRGRDRGLSSGTQRVTSSAGRGLLSLVELWFWLQA